MKRLLLIVLCLSVFSAQSTGNENKRPTRFSLGLSSKTITAATFGVLTLFSTLVRGVSIRRTVSLGALGSGDFLNAETTCEGASTYNLEDGSFGCEGNLTTLNRRCAQGRNFVRVDGSWGCGGNAQVVDNLGNQVSCDGSSVIDPSLIRCTGNLTVT